MVRYAIYLLILLSCPALGQTVSVGHTTAPLFFEHARFAFPDLATGGPGCCLQLVSTDNQSPAVRVSTERPIRGNLGLEVGAAYLGRMKTAFDVSGPFGTALQRPVISGRCVESGSFDFFGASALATYKLWRFTPKAGVSMFMTHQDTKSHCDFQFTSGPESVDKNINRTRFTLSPTWGLDFSTGKFKIGLEQSRPRLGYTQEAKDYGQTHIKMNTIWLSYSY
jgi:hypothetical protein